jgi:DNA-binding MarR family transcriptional regulator
MLTHNGGTPEAGLGRDRATLFGALISDVYELSGALKASGEALAQGAGQTGATWRVLSAASVGQRTVPQLARRLGLARQSVQLTANSLARKGLATFGANPDHQRSPFLELTGKGAAVLDSLTAVSVEHRQCVSSKFTARDLMATVTILRQAIALYAQGLATAPRSKLGRAR